MQQHSTSISISQPVLASLLEYLCSGSMHRQAAAQVAWYHKRRALLQLLLLLLVLVLLGPPGEQLLIRQAGPSGDFVPHADRHAGTESSFASESLQLSLRLVCSSRLSTAC
jgi:hypothetical protein